jgi:hypothetical protein
MTDTSQRELFSVDKRFIKVLNTLITSGQLAELQPLAFSVLCVIRAYVPIEGVSSYPSIELIAEKCGVGRSSVYKAIETLETLGWVEKTKSGRKNVYKAKDKYLLQSTEPEVRADEVAITPYGALQAREHEPDIDEYAKTGRLPARSVVQIEKINVNITIVNDGGTANVFNADASAEFKNVPEGKYRDVAMKMVKKMSQQLAAELDAPEDDK